MENSPVCIYTPKYKDNASLVCCSQTAKAKTKNANKVESKRQRELRAKETFSFIENEITTKYEQMKFIFGEQIYVKDKGPLGLHNKNTLWWLMKGPIFSDIVTSLLWVAWMPI